MSELCNNILPTLVKTRDMYIDKLDPALRWDKQLLTDSLLKDMVDSTKLVNIDSIIPSATARNKIGYNNKAAKNSKLKDFDNQRAVNLALTLVLDTMESIKDIASNRNVDLNQITDSNTGSVHVPFANIAQVLARQYLNSTDTKIAKGSKETVAKMELELGSVLLKPLIDKGIFTVINDANLPYNNQRDSNKERLEPNGGMYKGTVLVLNRNMINDNTIDHARAVSKLLNPTREILPSTEPQSRVDFDISKAHGVTLTDNLADTFSMLGQGAKQVHPLFSKFLTKLSTWDSTQVSSLKLINALTKGYGQDFANEIFGNVLPSQTVSDLRDSQAGVARTKSSNIINVLDNINMFINPDGSPKDLYFDYFGFRTGRSLANQNVLNAQTDKHFSRAILTSEPVTIEKDSVAFNKVIGALVDDYKFKEINSVWLNGQLDIDAVNEILNSPEFVSFKENFLDDNKDISPISQLKKFSIVSPNYIKYSNSLFDRIKGTALAYEVLTGLLNNEPTVTITHEISPDASGSGLFINLLQALNNGNKQVKEMFIKLGFLPDENGNFDAVYSSLYNYVSEDLDKEIKSDGTTDFAIDYNFITSIVDSLNARELAKMPVMTMGAYSQSPKNAMLNVGKELTNILLTQLQKYESLGLEQNNELQSILKQAIKLNKQFSTITNDMIDNSTLSELLKLNGISQLLQAYFTRDGGIASKLIAMTETRVKNMLFDTDTNLIETIYNQIDMHIKNNAIKTSDVKIISPQVMLDLNLTMNDLLSMDQDKLSELTNKYGLPLTKRAEMFIENEAIVQEEVMNLPSFIVSTTHMIDGAIQHRSLRLSLKEYKAKYGKFPGVTPVHDANNSNPLFAEIQDQNYIRSVFDVNASYNKVQMLLLTAKALGMDINQSGSALNSIQEQINKNEPTRQELIKSIVDNLNTTQFEGMAKVYGYKQTTKLNPAELNSFLGINELSELDGTYLNMYREVVSFFNNNPSVTLNTKASEFNFDPKGFNGDIQTPTNSGFTTQSKVKYLYHEIVHGNTVTYIDYNKESSEVKYLNGVITKLQNKLSKSKIKEAVVKLYGESNDKYIDANGESMSKAEYVENRFSYILMNTNDLTNLKETVAVLVSEPDMQEAFVEVVNELNGKQDTNLINKLKNILRKIIQNIKNFVLTDKQVNDANDPTKNIKPIETLQVIHKVNDLAKQFRKDIVQSGTEENYNEGSTQSLGATSQTKAKISAREIANDYNIYLGSNILNDPFSTGTAILNQYARAAIMLSLETYGKSLYDGYLTKGHISMMRDYPIYREVVELLQDARQNKHIQQIVHYMNVDSFKDRITKTKMLAMFNDAIKERNKIDSTYIRNLSDKLEVNFTTSEIANINTVYAKTGIFSLTHNSTILLDLLANDPTVKDDKVFLNDYINKYIRDNKVSATEVTQMQGLAELYVNNKVDGRITTDNVRAYTSNKARAYKLETLASLYALQQTNGIDTIRKVQAKSPDIHSELVQVATGIKSILNKLEDKLKSTEAPIMANIVGDVYKHNYQVIAVDFASFQKGNYNEDWQVLRKPSPGKLGLVYRVNINTAQPGLATNNNFSVDGLVLDKHFASKYTDLVGNNAVSIYMGKEKATKILFNDYEKQLLGLVENPAHSLYRTYSHLLFLHDTQVLRDTLISKAFTKEINDKTVDGNALKEEIKNPDVEHSWFLKINGSVTFNELPKEVKERYEPVTNITNLGQMASHITHVRKDIAPWLVGYSEPEIVSKNYKLNRLANVFKKLVAMQKIHWVIVNPVKISKDAISNFTYLISRNISVLKIYKYSSQVFKALPELNALRNDLVAAKLFADADPMNKSKQDKVISIQKSLNNHPFAFIVRNGYVSSISTDLILKDSASVTGLESDIENFLNKIVRDNKGDLNSIGKFISKAGKMGVSTEDALNVVSGILSKTSTTKGTSQLLDSVSNELVRIKEKEDVAKYLMQFIAAPGSEAVKLGSASIQSIEVVSKAVLHMHLKDIGKTENEAIQDVTDSFFDYTANMPESMKLLSDYSVLLFPTFWARIQRVIFMLGRDQPVSLASAFLVSEMLGLDSTHIIGSNLVSKFDNGSILNAPAVTTDAFYAGNIVPGL